MLFRKVKVNELKEEGKEPLRISPYYASLMQEDPFHPVMLQGEKSKKRLDAFTCKGFPHQLT